MGFDEFLTLMRRWIAEEMIVIGGILAFVVVALLVHRAFFA